jgi:hypothetical protein
VNTMMILFQFVILVCQTVRFVLHLMTVLLVMKDLSLIHLVNNVK